MIYKLVLFNQISIFVTEEIYSDVIMNANKFHSFQMQCIRKFEKPFKFQIKPCLHHFFSDLKYM